MLIIVPRSPGENQCVMTRPHGGQPMPLNQPTQAFRIPITTIARALLSAPMYLMGTIINAIDRALRIRPRGRKTRAFERSETLPIRNFERAYAAALIPSTKPSSAFWNPRGAMNGMASERFLRTR